MPGIFSERNIQLRSFLLSAEGMKTKAVTLVSTITDSGSTPTTLIRPGTVVGIVTASGKYAAYSNGNSDGTQVARGVLLDFVDMKGGDANGAAKDQEVTILVGGHVDYDQLLGKDTAAIADLSSPSLGTSFTFYNF